MTIEVLICSFNKGIVKIDDVLLPPRPDVNYIVSYQYTDERYLDLIPASLNERHDVRIYKYRGQGLSNNRNQAMSHATADIVLYADDDTRLCTDSFDSIKQTFEKHPDVDVALFRVSTYIGRWLKEYPAAETVMHYPIPYNVSTIEMAFRRERVKGKIRYDERFGLGTKFLTSGEEDIWIYDAFRHGLSISYFPVKIAETSMMLKQSMIYVDAGVQRSYGALNYYIYGRTAWLHCLKFAFRSTCRGYCHFVPMLRHLLEGMRYIKNNN